VRHIALQEESKRFFADRRVLQSELKRHEERQEMKDPKSTGAPTDRTEKRLKIN